MNWKKLFEPHILERGYGYYLNNAVNNLEVSEHTIRADVEGTEDYEVEISLVDGEIEEMYCSCPYAIGGWNCKHMAAVLYEWSVERGDQDNRDEEESVHIDTPEKPPIDIRKLVQKLKKISAITSIAWTISNITIWEEMVLSIMMMPWILSSTWKTY